MSRAAEALAVAPATGDLTALLTPRQRVNARVAEVALAVSRLDNPPPALQRAALVPTMRCEPGCDPIGGAVEFADPLPVLEDGCADEWIAVHLSSFFGLPTTTDEYYEAGPFGAEGADYEERIQWVRGREPIWRRIAADPLANLEWAGSEVADPWSALAAIFEWVRFLEEGFGMPARLPVVIEARHIKSFLLGSRPESWVIRPEGARGLPGVVLMAEEAGMDLINAGAGVFATDASHASYLAWFIQDGIEAAGVDGAWQRAA